MILADFGISTILSIIAFAASAASMIYAATRKISKGREGSRFGLNLNKPDPSTPAPMVFGKPRWRPPLLTRWLDQPNLNSFNGNDAKPRVNLVADCGIGEMDGSDLSVWLDKTAIFETVDRTSSASLRRLVDVLDTRKEFIFPRINVEGKTVLIYKDGKPYAVSKDTVLHDIPGVATTVETIKVGPPQKFFVPFGGNSQVGLYAGVAYPDYGDVQKVEVTVQKWKIPAFATAPVKDGAPQILTLSSSDYDIRTDRDGVRFISARPHIEPDLKRFTQVVGKAVEILEWRFAVETFSLVKCDIVVEPKTQQTKAVFQTAVPAGDITADYRSLPFGFEVETEFRNGAIDQEPLAGEGVLQTRAVGSSLTQGIVRSSETTADIDDFIVGIVSGPAGFYGQTKEIRGKTVEVRIRFRHADAPDAFAPTSGKDAGNPLKGWVDFLFNDTTRLPLFAKTVGGAARWGFRASDVIANWRTKAGVGPLPFARGKYIVEVVRLGSDQTDGAAELFWEGITEKIERKFSLPGRSRVRVSFQETKGLESEPEMEVQFKARKCRIYRGIRKVPYSEQLARFMGKAAVLPPGITSEGGFVDLSSFVYDPDLTEPDFVVKWTRNPVWICTEIILDGLGGGGVAGFRPQHIVWTSALAAANNSDRQITFGGRTDVACECDIVFDTATGLYAALTEVAAGQEFMPTVSRGKWYFPFDTDATDPVPVTDPLTSAAFTISDADVMDFDEGKPVDGLTFETKREADIATDFIFEFPDEEYDFDTKADPIYLPPLDPNPAKRIVKTVQLPGVRRRWQAERIAWKARENEGLNSRICTLKPLTLYPTILEPADVVVLDLPTAKFEGRKAMLWDRRVGSNQVAEMKFLILGGAKPVRGFDGPATGYGPPGQNVIVTDAFSIIKPPKSSIIKVEAL